MAASNKGLNFQGVSGHLESSLGESNSDNYREWLTQYMSPAPCAACGEQRLRPESLAVKIAGLSIADFTALALTDARPAVDKIRGKLTLRQRKIAGRPLTEIAERIDFLLNVGLGYLTLGAFGGHAFRRRSAADSPGHADWLAPARRAVRARRALDRPARPRQRTPALHA